MYFIVKRQGDLPNGGGLYQLGNLGFTCHRTLIAYFATWWLTVELLIFVQQVLLSETAISVTMASPTGTSTDFYLRYYVGHKGKFGHEFLEFEFRPDGEYMSLMWWNSKSIYRRSCGYIQHWLNTGFELSSQSHYFMPCSDAHGLPWYSQYT